MNYLYLAIAIVAEVIATSSLKATEGFTRTVPSLVMAVGYLISFYFLSLVVQTMQIGVVYAVWSGSGIVLVALVGAVFLKQVPDWPAVAGMLLILAGVIVVNLFSKTVTH